MNKSNNKRQKMKKMIGVLGLLVVMAVSFSSCVVVARPYGYGYAHPPVYAHPWYRPWGAGGHSHGYYGGAPHAYRGDGGRRGGGGRYHYGPR